MGIISFPMAIEQSPGAVELKKPPLITNSIETDAARSAVKAESKSQRAKLLDYDEALTISQKTLDANKSEVAKIKKSLELYKGKDFAEDIISIFQSPNVDRVRKFQESFAQNPSVKSSRGLVNAAGR